MPISVAAILCFAETGLRIVIPPPLVSIVYPVVRFCRATSKLSDSDTLIAFIAPKLMNKIFIRDN